MNIDHGDDDWAEVELFRWQYGVVPMPGDDRKLNISEGLRGMSRAIENGCKDSKHPMPTPFNICSILDYCARLQATTDQ